MEYDVVVGIEIHLELNTLTKMFSGAPYKFKQEANTCTNEVDLGMPGTLPCLNKGAVKKAIALCSSLHMDIDTLVKFDRKNYYYSDLPKGFQITQQFHPIGSNGYIDIYLNNEYKRIRINRCHMEEDTAKQFHLNDFTLIDYNRSGVPLCEIVSEPDITSGIEAQLYVEKLRQTFEYLGISDAKMEEGEMRCDVNVSVRKVGETEFRTRNEMKNVNSVKFVMQAIESEAKRHVETYENGGVIEQETRQFDPSTCTTKVMRKKEFAHDYRYFPEPDLLPLVLTDEFVEQIKGEMVELPDAKKDRFVKELGLTAYDASVICENKETADFFEKAAHGHEAKKVANWLMGDFFAMLNEKKLTLAESPVSAENLGNLVELVSTNVINGKTAKDVFALMAETGESPEKIVEEKGLRQVTDTSAIEKIVDDILAANPANVAAYKSGKVGLMGWFVGQVMKASQGKANPGVVNQVLSQKLS